MQNNTFKINVEDFLQNRNPFILAHNLLIICVLQVLLLVFIYFNFQRNCTGQSSEAQLYSQSYSRFFPTL